VKTKYIEINSICSYVIHKSAINTEQINNKFSAVPVKPSHKTQGVIVDITWPSDPSWHRMLTVGSGSIGLWYTGRTNGGEGVLGACLTGVVRLFVHFSCRYRSLGRKWAMALRRSYDNATSKQCSTVLPPTHQVSQNRLSFGTSTSVFLLNAL